jgi:hypothetical protein
MAAKRRSTMRLRVRILVVLTLALGAVSCLHASAHAFTIGMSDQKLGLWQDPRFKQLGIRQVRLLISYDRVLKGNFSRYDQWMRSAEHRRAEVLLTIQHHSRHPRRLPTIAQYRRTVRILVKRYPYVKTMSAWNEANHQSQPTYRRPKRAAKYFNVMRDECHGCRIVAADLLDGKNMLSWLATFKRYATNPRIWGLHSYSDANRFRPVKLSSTRQLLRAVKGPVWLTEAGGIVRFGTFYRGGRRGESRAADAVAHTFAVARSSRRIKRVYIYHWDADPKFIWWDSALVAANGRARPALDVVRKQMNKLRKGRGKRLPKLTKYPKSEIPLY